MSAQRISLVFGLLALGAAFDACSSSSSGGQPGTDGGGASGGDSGAIGISVGDAIAGSGTLGCLGVLNCVTGNNCSDNACTDTCLAEGTTDAQTQVANLATCNQKNSCTDSTCLQTNCMSELAACLAGSAPPPTGQPLMGGTAQQGSVPADFVGTWIAGDSADLSSSKQFVFNADGTGQYVESYNGGLGQCASAVIAKYQGTAVIDENAMTIAIDATTVTETTNACGTPNVMSEPAKTLSFTYAQGDAAAGLDIIDSDCASKYTAQADINLYCRYTYRKQ